MIPQPGQHVKLTFRNAIQIEGVVESWSDTLSVLHTLTDKKVRVIHKTKDDVMFYDILTNYISPIEAPKKLTELEEQFEEVYQQPSNNDLRLQSLAKLKVAMIEQEKAIISNKLKSHLPGGMGKALVQYGNPFLK